jgi:lipopolysaccharide transport system ATP-binding protein
MSNLAIKVEGLCKEYRTGSINHGMLYMDLQSWWAKKCGKQDPHARIVFKENQKQIDESGRFWALKDLSFELKESDSLGVIGKNGAGKSTLLKILSNITTPTKGIVKIRGRIASLLEVGTGFHPELTGRENVYLNGAILGMNKNEINKKFDEIVDFSEIEQFIDTPVKRYSSGMYVRLAFSVAAHLEPEILILDEVLAVGDAAFQAKCLTKMEKVGKEGRTIIFVSHSMSSIIRLCKSAILLENGLCVFSGNTKDVVSRYLETDKAVEENKGKSFVDLDKLPRWENVSQKIFKWISVHRSDGKESINFKTGDDIIIRIGYKIEKPFDAFCAVHFLNNYGEVVMSVRSTHEANSIFLSGKGYIECLLKNIRLLSGEYIIRPSIGSVLPVEDFIDGFPEAIRFTVNIGDYLNGVEWSNSPGYGAIAQKSSWHIELDARI